MTDDDIRHLLNRPQTRSAMEWLLESTPTRSLGEAKSHSASVELVQTFLDAGAKGVWVLDPTGPPDGLQNAGRLVVELPNDRSSRDQLLALTSEIAEELGFDPEEDTGQRYVLVMLD